MSAFSLAILGRPNVGKSTLFNRLAGKKLAIVDDTPGVTRDRREGEGHLSDLHFRLFDTAGLEEGDATSIHGRMRKQTELALDDADVILMMIDARAGVTPLDEHFANWLRRQKKNVILVCNKCEGKAGMNGVYEAFNLGFGEPIPLSAEHGEGLGELYTAIVESLKEQGIDPYAEPEEQEPEEVEGYAEDFELVQGDLEYEFEDEDEDYLSGKPLQMAIVGRPNAGKSTLINYLIEEDRLITGPEAGLTRDSISVDWQWEDQPVRLFDTAGLRKKAKITDKVEKLSSADTLRAIRFAHVVVLLIDAEIGIEKQDLRIAEWVITEGRALVIALNKWDAVDDRLAVQRKVKDTLEKSLPQLKGVSLVHFSALTGQGTQNLMPTVLENFDLWNARISTALLNQWLEAVIEKHQPPLIAGRRLKISFMAQVKTRPPSFVLFTNIIKDFPTSYLRYMENELRRSFGLPGSPIRLMLRKSENPYEGRRREKKNSKRGKRWKTGK